MDPLGGALPNMDDDLFGDEVMPMASRPPSKQLQQRIDEMRGRGCCRGIACSKQGTIASISPDGTYINLQCPRINPSDGTWELSEPTACSIFSAPLPGGPIVHLAWAPTNSPELAIVDAFGRVCILTFPLTLNKASFIARKWDSDAPDDLHSIVGSHWLPLYQARQFNITYGPAVRENEKYQYGNSITAAFGPWHPNPQKSALVCVTANGFLKLFFSQNSNQVQETQLEMESITSSDDLITHAAMCPDRGKLLVVLATAAKQLKVLQAEIQWGMSQRADKQIPPGSLPLNPSLKAERLVTTSWLQPGLVESHLDVSMGQISHLEVLPPVTDMKTKTSLPATILTVRSHVPTPQTPYNVEYQSIIDRWNIVMDLPQQLHPAFEQRGPKAGTGSTPSPMTRLQKRDSIIINKIIVSVETTQLGKLVCLGFSDGTIQYRDRITMAEIYHEEHQNQITTLQQAGFLFEEEKPCLQLALSPNNCSFTQVCENGKLKWNSLRYPVAQIGSTRQDPLYESVLAGLTLAAANATHQNTNYDDILAVARPFVGKHSRFLTDLVSTLVMMLNINIDYSEEAHHDQLVRNVQLQFVMSLLNHFGFRGEFIPRSFSSKFAMLGLNLRNIVILITVASNSPMNLTKEKWTPLDEAEVVDALAGCARWALDLLSWLADSLFALRDDPNFMELLTTSRFSEMTTYLKSKNDVSLHLLLCSSTRGFLSATCRRMNHLQTLSNKAIQFWEKTAPHNATDPSTTNRGMTPVQQAYLKMQRHTTTTLIKVEEIDKLLSTLSGDIRQTYQASLANLAQKQQQQQPGKPNQPPPDAAIKKAQAHCELMMLLSENPPPSFLPLVKKLFETDLRNLMASTKRSDLFFTDFELLDVDDEPKRLAARKAERKYVDTFKRVELIAPKPPKAVNGGGSVQTHDPQPNGDESGPSWRRCVRCCAVMEDVVAAKPGFTFVLSQQRKCSCGGNWGYLSRGSL